MKKRKFNEKLLPADAGQKGEWQRRPRDGPGADSLQQLRVQKHEQVMHHLQQERLQDDAVERFEEGLDQPGLREVFCGPRLLFLLFSFFLSIKPIVQRPQSCGG